MSSRPAPRHPLSSFTCHSTSRDVTSSSGEGLLKSAICFFSSLCKPRQYRGIRNFCTVLLYRSLVRRVCMYILYSISAWAALLKYTIVHTVNKCLNISQSLYNFTVFYVQTVQKSPMHNRTPSFVCRSCRTNQSVGRSDHRKSSRYTRVVWSPISFAISYSYSICTLLLKLENLVLYMIIYIPL